MTKTVVRFEQTGLMQPTEDGSWVPWENYGQLLNALERITRVKFMGSCCGCSSDGGFAEVQQIARQALGLPDPEPVPEPKEPSVRTIYTSDLRSAVRDLANPPGEDIEVIVKVDQP